MKNHLTVSAKGQITIPKKVRERLRLNSGSKLRVSSFDSFSLSLKREVTVDDFYGKFPDLWSGKDPVELVRALRDNDRT